MPGGSLVGGLIGREDINLPNSTLARPLNLPSSWRESLPFSGYAMQPRIRAAAKRLVLRLFARC